MVVYKPGVKAKAIELRKSGMSYEAIARAAKVTSERTIRRWVRDTQEQIR
ncbi:MAG: helix-turn-helix domain-containing protein [Chloroflexi bacterium]|nr:helix-turn-helix domain-containing protein [Chloroflexota bacterium]MCH8229126.1 helix-turn-helix domain-containing protein [Chloroflexota bacterium]